MPVRPMSSVSNRVLLCSMVPPSQLTIFHCQVTRPPRSIRITRLHRYYGSICPCASPVLLPHGGLPLVLLLRTLAAYVLPRSLSVLARRQVPCSASEPNCCSRHLYAGHHLDNRRALSRLLPGNAQP